MKILRYYISGHGLGHASRSCQIINTLRRRHPEVSVEVVSDAHPWFFATFLDPAVAVRRLRLDLGVVQHDSLIMCEVETLRTLRAWQPVLDERIREEARSLRTGQVGLVAADIPAAAFAAAELAGIPAVGISNFSWDWIYEPMAARHPGYETTIDNLRRAYGKAERLLRLPFHGDLNAFACQEDLPLVGRKGRSPADAIRRSLGIDDKIRLGLISFGGFGLGEFDFSRLGRLEEWLFLTEGELAGAAANLLPLPPGRFYYPDLVQAADAVITKPGYGIVSEAIINRTPVLYTERGDFREQALLIDGLHRYARARKIDNERLRRGDWEEELESLLAQPQPVESLAADGDEIAADRLAELLINR